MNKEICVLTSVHPVFDTRIFHKQITTLTNAGYNITLIAQHNKTETIEEIKIIPLPRPKNKIERFCKLSYLAYKKALQQNADIYHFHDPELIPWVIILKLKTKKIIIYDIHENVSGQILAKKWLPHITRYPIAYIYKLFENLAIKFFDFIIVAGDDIKSQNSKIIVIRNYPFKKESLINNSNLKKVTQKLHCIYIGGISEDRCIKEILESLNYLKIPILFTIIGSCKNKEYLQSLKSLIKTQKKHQIQLIDQLPYRKAMQYLKSVDVGFILLKPNPNNITAASRNNKLYEYMAAGLPVIASDFPLWKKIIEKNYCGICIDPSNPEKIAKAIEYLIKHPDEAKKMGGNGKKAVLEKYNWENESKKLLKTYKNLTSVGY